MQNVRQQGFTLIELSIVLVIIGLIVGGILVGQDLIAASEVRATISQMEKYQTATNTFFGKYGALPGDLMPAVAAQFGFAARAGSRGQGDGNGLLEGIDPSSNPNNNAISGGETAMFWVDLSKSLLIDGSFTTASPSAAVAASITQLGLYMPAAKLGRGNYVYVWGGGWTGTNGINYFGIEGIQDFSLSYPSPDTNMSMTVKQAYSIDTKIDDGNPMLGSVIALVDDHSTYLWAGTNYTGVPTTAATVGSATTCFDNSNSGNGTPGVNGNAQHYSVEINGGSGANCALSFRFQ